MPALTTSINILAIEEAEQLYYTSVPRHTFLHTNEVKGGLCKTTTHAHKQAHTYQPAPWYKNPPHS